MHVWYRHGCFLLAGLLLLGCGSTPNDTRAQSERDRIRLNQVGFYPDAQKVAVVVGADAGSFAIVQTTTSDTVHTGTLGDAEQWELSGEQVRRANFSDVQASGTYELHVEGGGTSHPFSIEENVHRPVAEAALKAYYYQRTSTPLTEEYAGKWARPLGHPDENVRVHPAAASEARPEGTEISAPNGW